MKKRFASMLIALVVIVVSMAGCSDSDEKSVLDIENRSCSPILSLTQAEAHAGELVDITVTLEGANYLWSMCGIHFSYDDVLTAAVVGESEDLAYTKGVAVENMTAFTAVNWVNNRTEEMVTEHKNSIFFAALGDKDTGRDGEILTVQFVIPEDAEVGTVYNLEFFYKDGDLFTNVAKEEEMQKYATENWVNGSITVI